MDYTGNISQAQMNHMKEKIYHIMNDENKWIKKINEYNTDCQLLLVGIKSDLEDKRVVTFKQVQEYIESNDISPYKLLEKLSGAIW